MQQSDVVLAPIPRADGQIKRRPALILREMPSHRDLLLCGISTQLYHSIPGFDEIISPTDADFASSGLVASALIRLSFLSVLPRKKIAGAIGSIAPERHGRLLKALSNYLVAHLEPRTASNPGSSP